MMSAPEDYARELRRRQSETERLVWSRLRGRRFKAHKFRRQVALGSYIVDFVCFDERLIVELDGGQHTLQRPYDAERTAWLESQGYRVLRFWNHEAWKDWDTVAEVIWRALQTAPLTPAPLPQGARGASEVARDCDRHSTQSLYFFPNRRFS